MGRGGLISILCTLGALFLLALLVPARVRAADQGWTPIVSKDRKAERLVTAPTPPSKADLLKDVAASMRAPSVAAPTLAILSEPSTITTSGFDITTGSINPVESTRTLSPADSARLFAAEAAGELTTGAVDSPGTDLARGYCVNIAGTAADARAALQQAKLVDLEKQIGNRITTLEAKTAEYKAWVERREEFLKRATNSLVKIYTQMEPDAAALQLVAMDEETAAALLMRLEPQSASAILNEMPPERAARLSGGIANASRTPGAAPPPMGARPGAPPPRPRADTSDPVDPNEG